MLWIKALHIIAAIAWFAGLFYLPRLFVYYAESDSASTRTTLLTMQRRLYKAIMIPAMAATLLFGVWLLGYQWDFYATQGWLHAKLMLIALLVVYHHVCGYYHRQMANGRPTRSSRFFRWFNELPTVLLILIVLLAVVRPF